MRKLLRLLGLGCVCWTALPIPATPLEESLKNALTTLDGLASPEVQALQSELRTLNELLRGIPPEKQAVFQQTIIGISSKVRNIRAQADFITQKHSDREIPYGIETSLVKLLKHSPFHGEIGGTVRLDAARNEMDAAQIVLFANDTTRLLTEVKVDGDLKAADGKLLPLSTLRLRRVGYVKTKKPYYSTEHVGLWPDPLMTLAPFDIPADSFETVWIDVRVPTGQPAALYKGSVTVTARNSAPTRIPLEVRVRNFTIPRKSSITTAFGMNPNSRWCGPQDKDAYLDNLLEHRITPYSCVDGPKLISLPTWNWANAKRLSVRVTPNQEADLVALITKSDGTLLTLPPHTLPAGKETVVDFAKEQIALEKITSVQFTINHTDGAELEATVWFEDGSSKTLAPSSKRVAQVADGWLQRFPMWQFHAWRQPDVPAVFDWTEFDAQFEKALEKGITSHLAPVRNPIPVWSAEFQRHLSAKGWLPYFYTYLFDEPVARDYPHVNDLLSQVKLAGPGALKNMMTARSFPPELPFVDIWCPELYSYRPELSAAEQKKDREVWWYIAFSTRHPLPNIWLDYPALDCRIWPWLSWKHDIDGMLYWSITHWPKNPWETGEMFSRANGDGSVLYPGTDGKPVDSIRWECLRDGMEDYEVFCLLEAATHELADKQPSLTAAIKRLCAIDDSVAAAFNKYNPNPSALLNARRQMSECLEQAIAALGHEPVIRNRPHRRRGVTPEEVRTAVAKLDSEQSKSPAVDFSHLTFPTVQPKEGLRLYYRFDSDLPYLFDYSGNRLIGMPCRAKRVAGTDGQAIQFTGKGYVQLPSGNELLGTQPKEGTIEFMVRPDFDPATLANTGRDQYACLFYLMETDGNSLPDGYDEIGLFIRNDRLHLRLGGQETQVGNIPNPFRQGQWCRVAIVWKPNERILYLDGKPCIRNTSPYTPPRLDDFHGTLGVHSTNHDFPFNATFDDLKIWSRALRDNELQ